MVKGPQEVQERKGEGGEGQPPRLGGPSGAPADAAVRGGAGVIVIVYNGICEREMEERGRSVTAPSDS